MLRTSPVICRTNTVLIRKKSEYFFWIYPVIFITNQAFTNKKKPALFMTNPVIFWTNSIIVMTSIHLSAYPDFLNPFLEWNILEHLEFVNKDLKQISSSWVKIGLKPIFSLNQPIGPIGPIGQLQKDSIGKS